MFVQTAQNVFKLHSEYQPTGDQPQAIEALVKGFQEGNQFQTLLGVTGSGKTFTMANVIQQLNKPTLVIAHNKTLAAQLYGEFKEFFPENAVEYFVSYYDYYQPEAYVPSSDTYIAKDSAINEEIDKLRLSATASLIERKDVIVISSVSCIYGLGSPDDLFAMMVSLRPGMEIDRDDVLRGLVDIQYTRNEMDFHRGTFRVHGDVVEIFPANSSERAIRVEFFGDEIDRITEIDVLTGEIKASLEHVAIFPASHYVMPQEKIKTACVNIEEELEERVRYFKGEDKLIEAQRIAERTNFDIEMLRETGFCSGIENYSRHLAGTEAGATPVTLMNYFDDYLIIIDESHITLPQVRGMYAGDRSRKTTLVEYGFRLPSALDNRPLNFEEFEQKIDQMLFVSATPGEYEANHELKRAEQIIRPTGLLDPEIDVRPVEGQIDDLIGEVNKETKNGNKVLITTLTKRMAEDLTDYMKEVGIRVKYLHSDIDTLERAEIIRDLRLDVFDVLVGINLLREGLDIPEITLVAILDADKEGFLRSETSLIQTVGRAARNSEGHVIMYADTVTDSMRVAIEETNRRRAIQQAYNEEHGITPTTIQKAVRDLIAISKKVAQEELNFSKSPESMNRGELEKLIKEVEKKMKAAASELNFEMAATLRDQMIELRKMMEDTDGNDRALA
ncbi:excinuclease ABC subunit UvrB [Lachnospiraceae bacterium 47-T17]